MLHCHTCGGRTFGFAFMRPKQRSCVGAWRTRPFGPLCTSRANPARPSRGKCPPPRGLTPLGAPSTGLALGPDDMAIYSCNLKSIGRTTHTAGTAGAHIRYIARLEAEPVLLADNMPLDPLEARSFLDRAERAARKNARVLDKIRIALPRELDEAQRAALVQDYMQDLTGGRSVPWYAAIHQTGTDAHNPHVHIAVHDRERETGKRVLCLSDSTRDRIKAGLPGPKAVDWIRERWEIVCNRALERAGVEARIDRRTLEAQGIDREAPIHIGPRASHIHGNVQRPGSQARVNGCGRVIDYPQIDKGKTRREFNAQIVDLNLERAVRSDNPVTAAWAAFEKDQLERDRALEDRLAAERRVRTARRRNLANSYNARIETVRAQARLEQQDAARAVSKNFEQERARLQARQRDERAALRSRQGRLYARLLSAVDITGTASRRQAAMRKRLSAAHKTERHDLAQRYKQEKQGAVAAVRDRYRPKLQEVRAERSRHLAELREIHRADDRAADGERQQRERNREQSRRITARKIQVWQKAQKETGTAGRQDAKARAFRKAKAQEDGRGRSQGGGRSRTRR